MKRYVQNVDLRRIPRVDTDVVIVGSGAAGLYAALNLDPGLRCAVLSKEGAEVCNSMYAQGGVAAVIRPGGADDPQQHFRDTLVAGAGLCDEEAVRVLVSEAWDNIRRLMELHVPFDMRNGLPLLAREGGHGRSRILRCGGDATGLHLTSTLYRAALQRDNILFYDNVLLTDVVTGEEGTAGVLALDEHEKPCWFAASRVVLATGGIGRVYRRSTNSVCSTGDGLAAAMRAGAAAHDMEFIQFHPTGFAFPREDGRYFLISEALRGEGAVLRNGRGEAFMRGVHPMAELAPRDIVARAIAAEMVSSGAPHVFLDITHLPDDFLKERFPTIFEHCLRSGIDMGKDPIPVAPVQHYAMGGIRTDTFGRTGVPGLYACGEAACTGVHGANRLASNSLLECLVFGRRCALDIGGSDLSPVKTAGFTTGEGAVCSAIPALELNAWEEEIRGIMTQKGGIVRNGRDLREASARIGAIHARLDSGDLGGKQAVTVRNMAEVGLSILQAALLRRQSVGAHCRSDEQTNGGRQPAGPLKKTS